MTDSAYRMSLALAAAIMHIPAGHADQITAQKALDDWNAVERAIAQGYKDVADYEASQARINALRETCEAETHGVFTIDTIKDKTPAFVAKLACGISGPETLREGWDLFDIDGNDVYEIQFENDAKLFESDDDALEFVKKKAADGSTLHQMAIACHEYFAPIAAAMHIGGG